MVTGRFLAAFPQSPSPPGCNDTEPSMMLTRATRLGGSLDVSSSSARTCGANKINRPATQAETPNLFRLANLETVDVFMTNPLFSEGRSTCNRTCWKRSFRWKPNTFAAPHFLKPQTGKEVALPN